MNFRYSRLTSHTISISSAKYTPLEWTSISWAVGLAVAAPALGLLSGPLDRNSRPTLIAFAAATVGAVFCLPAGFFRTVWLFPPYIAIITAAATVAAAHHTRHLSAMVLTFTGPHLPLRQFPLRRAASSWLSAAATSAGCLGAAVISAFAYHMLREREVLMSLWIVSIFSGLKWLLGSLHFLAAAGKFPPSPAVIIKSANLHAFSIFRFPHALGSLLAVFLSSLASMSVFIGAVLYLVGELCLNPKSLLFLWLVYFLVPVVSLPALHPVQRLVRASAVKMLLLGLFAVASVSGLGFSLRHRSWKTEYVLVFAAVQGSAVGVLHAFGRVLLLDCAPHGREAAFGAWLVWARGAGSCVGFGVASAAYGKVGVAFGVAFLAVAVAVVVLIFGNVSDLGGAVAAGHVRHDEFGEEKEERGSPVNGVDVGTASIQETP